MKIKLLRNLANRPDRLEGQTYTVAKEEGTALLAAGLAVDPDAPAGVEVDAADAPVIVPPAPAADGLEDLTVADLRKRATAAGLTPAASASKADLIDALRKK